MVSNQKIYIESRSNFSDGYWYTEFLIFSTICWIYLRYSCLNSLKYWKRIYWLHCFPKRSRTSRKPKIWKYSPLYPKNVWLYVDGSKNSGGGWSSSKVRESPQLWPGFKSYIASWCWSWTHQSILSGWTYQKAKYSSSCWKSNGYKWYRVYWHPWKGIEPMSRTSAWKKL